MDQAKQVVFDPHNPATWSIGREYVVDGHTWQICGNCGKVLRTDSWHGGIHVCN